MRRVLTGSIAGAALLSLALSAQAASPAVDYKPGQFPGAGLDMISHKLTIGLYRADAQGQPGERLETLKFRGRMLVERGDPYVTKEGLREIPFLVKNWEAFAWSDRLNSTVVYSLADVPQKMSTITAQQKESDYPAAFHFRVLFNADAFGQKITPVPYCGEPEGTLFMEVPPSGNRRTSPALTKFESTRIKADHPELGGLIFVPEDCGDEEGTTLVTYSADQKKLLNLPRGEN